jgi:hypothetical protein
MGLSPGPAGDANRKSTLLHPIACMGGECRRIVDPPVAYDNDWFAKLLAQEPTQAGLLAYMLVSFDGYNYDVVADFQEAKLNASGRPVYGTRTFVQYAGVCPRPQHAEDTANLGSEMPTTGVLGSYDLQSRFLAWSGCTNERLLQELGRSFERIAGFWRARLTPGSASEIAAKLGNWEKLPLVHDVLQDAPACKSQYGEYRVVRQEIAGFGQHPHGAALRIALTNAPAGTSFAHPWRLPIYKSGLPVLFIRTVDARREANASRKLCCDRA